MSTVEKMRPGFAVDQTGARWIVFEKPGVRGLWAVGMGDYAKPYQPIIRLLSGGNQVEAIDQGLPHYFRDLSMVPPGEEIIEACAKVADDYVASFQGPTFIAGKAGREIAAAIRSLSPKSIPSKDEGGETKA